MESSFKMLRIKELVLYILPEIDYSLSFSVLVLK